MVHFKLFGDNFTFYPLFNLTHQETKYMFVIRYRSVT